MKDRFDLEREILTLHEFTNQLDLVNEGILEYDLSLDDAANAITGIKVMLDLHAQKMFDTMRMCFNLKD